MTIYDPYVEATECGDGNSGSSEPGDDCSGEPEAAIMQYTDSIHDMKSRTLPGRAIIHLQDAENVMSPPSPRVVVHKHTPTTAEKSDGTSKRNEISRHQRVLSVSADEISISASCPEELSRTNAKLGARSNFQLR